MAKPPQEDTLRREIQFLTLLLNADYERYHDVPVSTVYIRKQMEDITLTAVYKLAERLINKGLVTKISKGFKITENHGVFLEIGHFFERYDKLKDLLNTNYYKHHAKTYLSLGFKLNNDEYKKNYFEMLVDSSFALKFILKNPQVEDFMKLEYYNNIIKDEIYTNARGILIKYGLPEDEKILKTLPFLKVILLEETLNSIFSLAKEESFKFNTQEDMIKILNHERELNKIDIDSTNSYFVKKLRILHEELKEASDREQIENINRKIFTISNEMRETANKIPIYNAEIYERAIEKTKKKQEIVNTKIRKGDEKNKKS